MSDEVQKTIFSGNEVALIGGIDDVTDGDSGDGPFGGAFEYSPRDMLIAEIILRMRELPDSDREVVENFIFDLASGASPSSAVDVLGPVTAAGEE